MPTNSDPRFQKQYGTWALIAGAAEGLGEGLSVALAARGMNLIMIDNNLSAMNRCADRIEKETGVATVRVHLDLAAENSRETCMAAINTRDCRLLVYNAAYSRVRRFLEHTGDDLDAFIAINCHTPVRLVHAFANKLKTNQSGGGILFISSLAGLIGPQYVSPYAATKSFQILLAESLNREFRHHSIDVTVCCAGTTSTPMFWSTSPNLRQGDKAAMEPLKVANFALGNLGRKTICIPGWKNRFSYFLLTRLLPRKTAARLVSDYMEKLYPGK
jgi:short-subunit dehydrogenase